MKKITILLLCTLFLFSSNSNSQEAKFGKVTKEELQETKHPLDSTANAAYLYKYRSTYFRFNEDRRAFDIITERNIKIKVYNKDGFNHANTNISYYDPPSGNNESVSSIKGYTYNLIDGKIKKDKLSKSNIFKEKKNKYWSRVKLTMPNIKEGCIIELKYSITSPYWDIRDLQFQSSIPIKNLYYHTSIPEYFRFNKQSIGYYSISPKITSKANTANWTVKSRSPDREVAQTYYDEQTLDFTSEEATYKSKNIPAISSSEPYISSITNYLGAMKYELASTNFPNTVMEQYSTSWEAVAKKIHTSASFGEQLNKHSYFKKNLEEITASSKNKTEKINNILKHVKSKIKWNNNTGKYTEIGVKKAYSTGSGNVAEINLILVAMLREAGLHAYPVLLSTRDNGVPIFPTSEGLNYVIAAVKSEQGDYTLLDASERYSSPNNLPKRVLNWEGKLVSKTGGFQTVPLTPKIHAKESHSMLMSFDDKLKAKGMLRSTYSNLFGLNYRKKYNRMKEAKLITTYEKKYPIEIEKIKITNKGNFSKSLSQTMEFTSDDIIETINQKVYLNPLFFLKTSKNPFKLEDRKYPVDFATPWQKEFRISIDIPLGYKVESLPKSSSFGLSDKLGLFKYQLAQIGNKIQVVSIFEINRAVIIPKYYRELKNLYKEMIIKQAEKIVLVKI